MTLNQRITRVSCLDCVSALTTREQVKLKCFSDALAIINDDYQRGNSKLKECQNVGDDRSSSAKQLSRFFGGPGVTHGVTRRELFALLSILGVDVLGR